jgi:nucleotide-binding universal stress UspA family protein
MMNRILVCTDGSSYSLEACRFACWLASQNELSIDVLYVTDARQFEVATVADLSGSLGVQPYEGMLAQLHEVERMKSEFVWDQARQIFEKAGLVESLRYHHETGMLVDRISDYESRNDLIILGKRGEHANYAAQHLGSVLERTLRAVKTPCFITSRKFKTLRRLALAYDGGESARKALSFISSVSPFKDLEIHIVAVAESAYASNATANLAEAQELTKAMGIDPICQVLSGEVGFAISNYVVDANIDMLTVGAYGHSRIREFLIGSTTTELLCACNVPFLCFR